MFLTITEVISAFIKITDIWKSSMYIYTYL